jgi:hypothetical protein
LKNREKSHCKKYFSAQVTDGTALFRQVRAKVVEFERAQSDSSVCMYAGLDHRGLLRTTKEESRIMSDVTKLQDDWNRLTKTERERAVREGLAEHRAQKPMQDELQSKLRAVLADYPTEIQQLALAYLTVKAYQNSKFGLEGLIELIQLAARALKARGVPTRALS